MIHPWRHGIEYKANEKEKRYASEYLLYAPLSFSGRLLVEPGHGVLDTGNHEHEYTDERYDEGCVFDKPLE